MSACAASHKVLHSLSRSFVNLEQLATGACRKVLKAKAISCLDFLLEEGVLCAGLYDTGRVMVWDMKTWEVIQILPGHNRGIRNVAISKDHLVSVGQDKAIVGKSALLPELWVG